MDKISYSLGTLLATNLKQQGFESLNGADFHKGFQAILDGTDTEISLEDANNMVQNHLSQLAAAKHIDVIKEGEAFLSKNGEKEGVTVLPSGLQYEVIKSGDGAKPAPTDKVTTHYEGTLIDGRIFDSSIKRGEPATFPVNGVIPGWVEALQLMNVGSKWRLFIPSNLAYGERGAGELIGPHSTLIFDIELISIN